MKTLFSFRLIFTMSFTAAVIEPIENLNIRSRLLIIPIERRLSIRPPLLIGIHSPCQQVFIFLYISNHKLKTKNKLNNIPTADLMKKWLLLIAMQVVSRRTSIHMSHIAMIWIQ